jgi:hypothetical protein
MTKAELEKQNKKLIKAINIAKQDLQDFFSASQSSKLLLFNEILDSSCESGEKVNLMESIKEMYSMDNQIIWSGIMTLDDVVRRL